MQKTTLGQKVRRLGLAGILASACVFGFSNTSYSQGPGGWGFDAMANDPYNLDGTRKTAKQIGELRNGALMVRMNERVEAEIEMEQMQAKQNQIVENQRKIIENQRRNLANPKLIGSKTREELEREARERSGSYTIAVEKERHDRFYVGNQWIDGLNGGDKDNALDYPREIAGLGKSVFFDDEPITFFADLYNKKDSLLGYKVYHNGRLIKELSGTVLIERNNSIRPLRVDKLPSGEYKIEWYLDGNPQVVGVNDISVNPRNPIEAKRPKFNFYTGSEWVDGSNGGNLDNRIDYPREIVNFEKDKFFTDEPMMFFANIQNGKYSTITQKVYLNNTLIADCTKRFLMDEDNKVLSFKLLKNKLPGEYRVEWYLNDEATPICIKKTTVVNRVDSRENISEQRIEERSYKNIESQL
jgi:hypothetical protein